MKTYKDLMEVLSKDAEAGEWISDFIKSDDPKFEGKSKEKRKQMALAAYYANQKNESVETPEQEKARKELDLKLSKWKNQQRLPKSEEVELDEKSDQAVQNKTMKNNMDTSRGAKWKAQNNMTGDAVRDWDGKHKTSQSQNKAIGRALRNEDAEELDELSNKLLNRYSKKAEKEAGKHFMAMDRAQDKGNYDKAQTHMDKAEKRASGVYRAQSKIKEESLDEISAELAGKYFDANTGEKRANASDLGITKPQARKAHNRITGANRALDRMYKKEEVEQIDELSKDTLSSYANKAFAQGNDLHQDLSYMRGNKATDAERKAIRDKISKRNSGVIKASQKMNKEDMDEAVDTVKRDEKGKVIAWSHEGDWEKSSTKNGGARGKGKVANLSDIARRKSEKLAKEEVELDEKVATGEWHVHDSKSGKVHSTYDTHKKAMNAMNKLNSQHDGYKTPGGITQSKFAASAASYHKEDLDESAWGNDKMTNLRQAHDRHMEKAIAANKAGDDVAVKTHQRKMQMIKGKMQKLKNNEEVELGEECEILSELSKKTLGSYIKVAAKDAEASGRDQEHYGDQSDYDRGTKRQKGIAKAVDKLTKEEVEELDELDKKTMGNYITKAHDQLMKHTSSVNFKGGRGDKDAFAYAHDPVAVRKTANRTKGMETAIKKLTKEEEELEEKRGLWDNIHAKRKRIAAGSGEKMRKPGSEGAPTERDLKNASEGKEYNMKSFGEFMSALQEELDMINEGRADDVKDKLAAAREKRLSNYDYSREKEKPKSNVTVHKARYNMDDNEKEEDDEVKKSAEPEVKKGRGRPKGWSGSYKRRNS